MPTDLELARWVESVPTESQDTLAAIADRLRRLDKLEKRPDPLARLERYDTNFSVHVQHYVGPLNAKSIGIVIASHNKATLTVRAPDLRAALTVAMVQTERKEAT